MSNLREPQIAVLLPCFNEEATVSRVIAAFREALPSAALYVYDNGSTDGTVEIAEKAGAIVRHEPLPGKGNVVRRMFRDVEADIYVLADGDATYDGSVAPKLIGKLIDENLDMVVGTRKEDTVSASDPAYRPGHRFGNSLFTKTVAVLFGNRFSDILSGYRVFSRRFVKSVPLFAQGFDIETELTIRALAYGLPVAEVETLYGARPPESRSKLNSITDGLRILTTILLLLKEVRPFAFFSAIFMTCFVLSLALGTPVIVEFMATGMVPRFPTAILAMGIMLAGIIGLVAGIILDTVSRARLETMMIGYLARRSVIEELSVDRGPIPPSA